MATERHLWVNLANIGEKEKSFLLDTPVSPSELFGTSVETIVHKFREAKARSVAYESFILRQSISVSKHRGGGGGGVTRPGLRARWLVWLLVVLLLLRVDRRGDGSGDLGKGI